MSRIAPVIAPNIDNYVPATLSQVKATLGKIPNTLATSGNACVRNASDDARSSPMKIRFFQAPSLAIAVALIAACSYASAQPSNGDLQLVGGRPQPPSGERTKS